MKRKLWSKDDIILAMWEWDEKHGQQPGWADWLKAAPEHPSSVTVNKLFGSWNKAILEAGFTPYEASVIWVFDEDVARKLRREGITDADIGRQLGVPANAIGRRLGPRPRPKPVGKKRTREQRIADLKEALKKGDE